ncbi:MAG TPA: antitoxin VapB family protein [Tepidisphaeraceae bacterium]|nr:antitoxin VapB family protein [Tepidisphaeraceae bacterium]
MATKTISIDMEAYRRLKSVQQANESFSQTIKRVVPKPFGLEKWLKMMDQMGEGFSKEFVDAVEHVVEDRRAPRNMRGPVK